MKIFGSLSLLIILAMLIVFEPIAHSATISEKETTKEPTEEDLYQIYAELFFIKQELNQAVEMSIREAFLNWLYYGIVLEVRKRKRTNPDLTLEALTPTELDGYSVESYHLPDNINDASLLEAYLAYDKYDRDEYNHKYLKARLIKENLISTANPKQRLRMFNKDLSSTINTYSEGQYTEAVLKFDELIKEYGFDDLDDIFFYRGESYFALNLGNIAIKDFERVLSSPDIDPIYHKTALNRLISLYGNLGDQEKFKEYWKYFQEAYSDNFDDEYWQVSELVGRYLMIAGDLTGARTLFDQIPQSNNLFIHSRLLAAQASLMQLDLDDAENRFNLLILPHYGKVQISQQVINEAKLKIGYVNFLRGQYDEAYSYFSQIRGDESLREVALISSAWTLYRLNVYDRAITTCNSFISQFPNSEYQYEAIALMGHCQEIIGQDTLAVDLFEEIMSAVDDRQDYRDFVYEKKQIAKISSELELIESEVFGENKRDSFEKYLSIRKKLTSLKQKVRLAEGYKANPEIEDIVVEQGLLVKVIYGQQELEKVLLSSQDRIMIGDYEAILTNLNELSFQVSGSIEYELSRQNLTQREEKNRHEAILSDSLKQSTMREIQSIDKSLNKVNEIKSSLAEVHSPELMIEITAINDDLQNMRKNLLQVQTKLSSYGGVQTKSSLDEWSDFAYLRYTYGGLNFDNISAQQKRLVELDKYIQHLSQLLAERHRVDEDSTKLSANLILASSPGEDPYNAPPIPLWGENMSTFSEVQTIPDSETESDTMALETPAIPLGISESSEIDDTDVSTDEFMEDSEPAESEAVSEPSSTDDATTQENKSPLSGEPEEAEIEGSQGSEEETSQPEEGIEPEDNNGELDSSVDPVESGASEDSDQDGSIKELEALPEIESDEMELEEEPLDAGDEMSDPLELENGSESSDDQIDSNTRKLLPDEGSESDGDTESIDKLLEGESKQPQSDEDFDTNIEQEEGDQKLQDDIDGAGEEKTSESGLKAVDPSDQESETEVDMKPSNADQFESAPGTDPAEDSTIKFPDDLPSEEKPVEDLDTPEAGGTDPKSEETGKDALNEPGKGNKTDESIPEKQESNKEETVVPRAEPDEDPKPADPTQP